MQTRYINLLLNQRITSQFLRQHLKYVDDNEYIIEHILSVLRHHTDKFKLPLPYTFIYEHLEVVIDCDVSDDVCISNFKIEHVT